MPKNPLWAWGCKVVEPWLARKAGFQGAIDSPWKDAATSAAEEINMGNPGKPSQILSFILSPDLFYRSAVGKSFLRDGVSKNGTKDLGLLGADAETRLRNAKMVEDHGPFLQMIDPFWEHKKPGMKTFDQEASDAWTKYVNGEVKTKDLPSRFRNEAAALKQWQIDAYNATDELKELSPGKVKGTWELDDDIVKPTIKAIFNADSINMGQYGLHRNIPKEIPYRILKEGNAKNISGADWLKAAGPMVTRKNQFDPVIKRMREGLGELPQIEQEYTSQLLDRLVGRRTKLQNVIDGTVNNARFMFGGAPLEFSASARFSTGLTKAFYDGALMFNPGAAIWNFSQSLNILAKEGEMRTLKGFKNFISKEGRELAAERKFLGDTDKFYYRNAEQGKAKKLFEKFEHAGYYFFNKAENFNRGLGFHTTLVRFMEENSIKSLDDFLAMRSSSVERVAEKFQEGMRVAIEGANETQFLYSTVNQSPLLSTPLAKLVGGQFMSFPLRQSEFIMKQFRQGNGPMFLARYMGYTGAASALAYYGLGISMGDNLGGGGSIPEALDLAAEGKTNEAIWAATLGTFSYLPNIQGLSRGVTPFGSLLIDTLGLMGEGEPEAKWTKVGRSSLMAIPAGLEASRLIQGAFTQYAQEGKRRRPSGLGESLSIPVMLSAASKKVFGTEIPGVSTSFTGSLQRVETVEETVKASLGLRGRKIEMESRIMEINNREDRETKQGMSQYSARIANALLDDAPPEEFSAAMEEAIGSGLFGSPQSLHQSIENAMRQRSTTDEERLKKRSPLSNKIKRAINGP